MTISYRANQEFEERVKKTRKKGAKCLESIFQIENDIGSWPTKLTANIEI